jgi:hypothetical protein
LQEASKYSASASLLGYLYQCRLALIETLKRLKSDPSISVSIETLDDVVFERDGNPTDIIQVKHHIARKASLTDASTDLWKTIRIWCDLFSEGSCGESAILHLMTTEKTIDSSAAHYLRSEGRDIDKAEKLLLQTSQTSTNESNKIGYQKFNELMPEQRKALLERVFILDNCPSSRDIQDLLSGELWGHCERRHMARFVEYLEGWWFQRIVAGLDGSQRARTNDATTDIENRDHRKHKSLQITGREIDAQLNSLRERFKTDSLPIHPEIQSADPDIAPFSNWVFARQLRLINLTENRVERAAKNYYQASEQRSRWVRESLLVDNDVEQYDDRLIDEWDIRFDQAKDALTAIPTSDEQIASGKKVYKWVEAEASIPIRSSCQELFITRGSFQILANQLKVGWHPQFIRLIANQSEES